MAAHKASGGTTQATADAASDARDAELRRTQRELADAQLMLMGKEAAFRNELKELQERNAELLNKIVKLTQRDRELQARILDAQFDGSGAKAEVKKLDEELRDLRRAYQRKETELTALATRVEELKQVNAAATERLGTGGEGLEMEREALDAQAERIRADLTTMADLTSERSRLRSRLLGAEEDMASLKRHLSEALARAARPGKDCEESTAASSKDATVKPEAARGVEPEAARGAEAEAAQGSKPEAARGAEPEAARGGEAKAAQGSKPETARGADTEAARGAEPEAAQGAEPEAARGAEPEATESFDPATREEQTPEPSVEEPGDKKEDVSALTGGFLPWQDRGEFRPRPWFVAVEGDLSHDQLAAGLDRGKVQAAHRARKEREALASATLSAFRARGALPRLPDDLAEALLAEIPQAQGSHKRRSPEGPSPRRDQDRRGSQGRREPAGWGERENGGRRDGRGEGSAPGGRPPHREKGSGAPRTEDGRRGRPPRQNHRRRGPDRPR